MCHRDPVSLLERGPRAEPRGSLRGWELLGPWHSTSGATEVSSQAMWYLSCAWRAAAPRLPAPWRSPRSRGSATGLTARKSVPYEKTLQEDGSGSGEPSRPPPCAAEVVVVGGGSLGCQTTYHLAKQGVTSVVLLERDRLTSGTTWHTAGEVGGTAGFSGHGDTLGCAGVHVSVAQDGPGGAGGAFTVVNFRVSGFSFDTNFS